MSWLDPPMGRREFLELPLGWLLADCLDGPMLVYRQCDVFRAEELADFLPELRRRVAGGYASIARAKREKANPTEARKSLGGAIRQLKALHRRLVQLARGYSFNAREWGPWGRPEYPVYLFDAADAHLVGEDWHPVAVAYAYPTAEQWAAVTLDVPPDPEET